jgi:hypothetical protein
MLVALAERTGVELAQLRAMTFGWDRNTAERGREPASPLVGAGGG